MANETWKAPVEVAELLDEVKNKFHKDRLGNASIVICFVDAKPFVNNKLNLGKVSKFSPLVKLWQNKPHDFCIVIPASLWHSILKGPESRLAYLDLMLSRCSVEYELDVVEENGKKKKNKDEWGRVQYSDVVKLDENGNPKWKVLPLDLEIFSENVRRYGLWNEQLLDFAASIG